MASEQLKLIIDVATAQAVKETKNLAKAVQGVGTEEADLRTAAQRTADALDAASSAMIADLKRSESAAEALGRSLGPELAAKVGEAKLDSFISDLRRMGLSFEEIEANSDRFAASLRKIDESTGSIKNVEGAVARLGHESDNSRSVLANMVGNSVQDLGALGGVAGSAGVMIGQLAEYAADGNIGLAGLASTAGPMLGLGLAVAGITKLMESAAEQTKFAEERVSGLTGALEDTGKSKTTALEDFYLGLGKIEVQVDSATDSMAEFGHGIAIANRSGQVFGYTMEGDNTRIIDITKSLTDLGLGISDWAQMVASTPEVVRAWGDALVAQGADQEVVNEIVSAAIAEQIKYGESSNAAATWAQFASKAAREQADDYSSVDGAAIRAANSIDIMNAAIAGGVSLQGSYVGVIDSLSSLQETLGNSEAGWVDQQNAIIGAQNSVIDYVNQLGGIPPEKLTQILAMLSQGNIDGVLSVINQVTRDRTISLTMAWKNGGINPAEDMPATPVVTVDVVPHVQAPVHHGGNGGGGGTKTPAKTPAEIEAEKAAQALKDLQEIEDNKHELGLISDAAYRKILEGRLANEKKYSDEYTRIVMQIKDIDDKAAQDKADKDEAASDRAAKAVSDAQEIEDNKHALGLISDAEYRKILEGRLANEKKYSDEYTRIAMQIKGIDDKTAKDKAAKDKAAHDRAEKAKKDREEAAAQARRLADEEMQRQANRAIVNANILGASYANIYTSADPNAVVNAIQQWQRRNGPVPIKTTG